ncbi:DUF3080 family protein [Vibrio sp. NTOU-M3]|uniref:DUF3080 family protein n=1 Tax=Vibrio sp. NTOU-M3 TaxID=3234954 RepID=UPI00349FAE4F
MYLKVVLICTVLTGCNWLGKTPAHQLEDYLTRISRVQGAPAAPLPKSSPIMLPLASELRQTIEPISLGLLESYELRKCGLFNLIAERNSVLGKVQDEFRNFDYQNRLITGLRICLEEDEISEELRERLKQIYQTKRSQLKLHLINLTFTSQAMTKQLNGAHWLTRQSYSELDHAFQTLLAHHTSVAKPLNSSELQAVVGIQEVLEKQRLIGNLTYSFVQATAWIDTIVTQLENNDNAIECGKNRDQTQFNYLKNILHNTYMKELQPYLAWLDAVYYDINPMIMMLQGFHPDYQYPLVHTHKAFQ